MAERSRCDLPYGQYGRIEYQSNDKSLSFGRQIQLPAVVSFLGEPKVIEHPIHADHFSERVRDGEPKGKRHARQIKALVQAFPEFEPATDLLSPLLGVSEAVEDAQSHHDPAAGNIVAFAKIRSQIRHRAVPVVAMRTGTTGCTLHVAQLEMQRNGWAENKTTWLEMPTIGSDQTTWNSSGGSIEQLVFADEAEHWNPLLAVRLKSKITIFRVSIPLGSAKAGTPSGLKLNLVFECHGNPTSGRSYMDVAFNPWFSQQIAVIDSAGEWQVLEIPSGHDRQCSVICKGTTLVGTGGSTISDGWARIAWVSDMATIATCTRQQLTVCSIRDAEPVILEEVPLPLVGNLPWVLEFMRLPSDKQRFAVLTSTHLSLYQVARAETEGARATLELKIRHYQNPEDLSLRLTYIAHDEDVALGVSSNIHSTLSIYQLSESQAGRITSSDPYHITLPLRNNQATSTDGIRDLYIRPIRLCRKHVTNAMHDPDQSSNPGRYHTLTAIRSSGIVEETLYHVQVNTDQPSMRASTAPSWTSKSALKPMKVGIMDAMVDDSAYDAGPREARIEPIASRARQRPQDKVLQQGFLDLEALASALNHPTTPARSVEEAVAEIRATISRAGPENLLPPQMLNQLLDSELLMDEVEQASTELQYLFSSLERVNDGRQANTIPSLQLESVVLPRSTNLSHDPETTSLSTAYERIVLNWISALPSQIAGRIRLAKREQACRIAAELILASRKLRPAVKLDSQGCQLSARESHDPVATWDLPVRATRTGVQSIPPSSSIPKSSTQPSSLPTPSPTATPSITTASSQMSTAAPQLDRLAAYTSFSKPTPLVLPRSLTNVLSHWEIGSDPNEYDWMSKSRHISQIDDDETQGLTEKERQRAQRHAERHLRRQRKEAAASQASQLASSQAVDVISTSQRSLANTGSQRVGPSKSSQTESKSQSQGRDAVASQIVRGPYGGRPPKKKRKEGF